MQTERIELPGLLQKMMRLPACSKIILAVDFEKPHRRGLIEERPVVRGTPPDTGSAIVCWHRDHGDLGICLAVRTLRLKALYFLATTEPPTIFSQEPLGT